MDRIEIYTNKKKSFLLLIASIAFVAIGIWLVIEADNLTGYRARSPIFTSAIGVASILLFGVGIFVSIKRLIKSEVALIIDPTGLNVNPKKSPTEIIKWEDITGFEEIKIQSNRIIIIGIKNPEFWLEKETGKIRKKLMQFNINNYNSPFNVSASSLDISADELKEKLNIYFNKYRSKS